MWHPSACFTNCGEKRVVIWNALTPQSRESLVGPRPRMRNLALTPRYRAKDLVLMQRRWLRNLFLVPRHRVRNLVLASRRWSRRPSRESLKQVAAGDFREQYLESGSQDVIVHYDDTDFALRSSSARGQDSTFSYMHWTWIRWFEC